MPEFGRTLPARPNLEQQQKLAKDLLAAFRRGDTEALARVRAELPDKKEIRLADAQYVLAREYGFASSAKLPPAPTVADESQVPTSTHGSPRVTRPSLPSFANA